MPAPARIQVNDVDGIKIVRFNDQQLFDERTVREASEQIALSLPSDGTSIRLVLDFAEVNLISSSAFQADPDPAPDRCHPGQAPVVRALADPPASLPYLQP